MAEEGAYAWGKTLNASQVSFFACTAKLMGAAANTGPAHLRNVSIKDCESNLSSAVLNIEGDLTALHLDIQGRKGNILGQYVVASGVVQTRWLRCCDEDICEVISAQGIFIQNLFCSPGTGRKDKRVGAGEHGTPHDWLLSLLLFHNPLGEQSERRNASHVRRRPKCASPLF